MQDLQWRERIKHEKSFAVLQIARHCGTLKCENLNFDFIIYLGDLIDE